MAFFSIPSDSKAAMSEAEKLLNRMANTQKAKKGRVPLRMAITNLELNCEGNNVKTNTVLCLKYLDEVLLAVINCTTVAQLNTVIHEHARRVRSLIDSRPFSMQVLTARWLSTVIGRAALDLAVSTSECSPTAFTVVPRVELEKVDPLSAPVSTTIPSFQEHAMNAIKKQMVDDLTKMTDDPFAQEILSRIQSGDIAGMDIVSAFADVLSRREKRKKAAKKLVKKAASLAAEQTAAASAASTTEPMATDEQAPPAAASSADAASLYPASPPL
jgi:hypothetical protein